ncbi:hypothetical protein L7E55_09190 [Pelotomaculum isophthalicicum JI]|uniref:Uncharacterized protein n=1 Tax=Pelotomaculum isophthalicicum JI TaxID=947010 RepID=A0A9X4JU61_9FIRM|nr:hypothetical protein [Pelotomaculum isophthalicicum]MDF9408530.1 hypothetical protein [Pelotomaculum isophthalicicum JI]
MTRRGLIEIFGGFPPVRPDRQRHYKTTGQPLGQKCRRPKAAKPIKGEVLSLINRNLVPWLKCARLFYLREKYQEE